MDGGACILQSTGSQRVGHGWVTSLSLSFYRTVLPGFCLPLANYLVFFPRTLPNIYMHFLLRWIPPQRTMGAGPHLLWGGILSLFYPQGAFRCMCGEGSFPDLRSGLLIPSLQQSSDSATSFVLGVSGWIQSLNFPPLDKHQLSSPGPHLSLTSDSLGS